MPEAPAGSAEVRGKLISLKSEAELASRVPADLDQAEIAVRLAETPQPDAELAAHRIYLADHLIDTARATAQVRLAESQRPAIQQQGDVDRLAARTREADRARNDATQARNEADAARSDATAARLTAETARAATAAAAAAAEAQRQELAEQIALLQARTTERGIVLTLGDVLFATGSADLKPGAIGNLDRLVVFMDKYGDRSALVEGHTDSMGSDAYNQDLSLRRADSVRGYLAGKGVASARLTSAGRGESAPVATNESAAGRQQNRRVEVVIENHMPAAVVTR